MQLTPGERLQLKIKTLRIFPDGYSYYILEDSGGRAVLLPEDQYKHYDLQVGQNLICTLDKVNCNGKWFLEPDHPFYRAGQDISLAIQSRFAFAGFWVLLLADELLQVYPAVVSDPMQGEETFLCRVFKIRKGRLILESPCFISILTSEDFLSECNVLGSVDTGTAGVFHVLQTSQGIPALLEDRAVSNAGIVLSAKQFCQLSYRGNPGFLSAEPVPDGKIPGSECRVWYQGIITRADLMRGAKKFIMVKDESGRQLEILAMGLRVPEIKMNSMFMARVEKIRNGYPVLSISQQTLDNALTLRDDD